MGTEDAGRVDVQVRVQRTFTRDRLDGRHRGFEPGTGNREPDRRPGGTHPTDETLRVNIGDPGCCRGRLLRQEEELRRSDVGSELDEVIELADGVAFTTALMPIGATERSRAAASRTVAKGRPRSRS